MTSVVLSLVDPRSHLAAARDLFALLTRHGELLWEMTRREVADRYAGQVFGALWAIGHPIFLMAIYVTVFGFVFRVRFGEGPHVMHDPVVYILSGLIPWMAFQEAMGRSVTSIADNAHLVKQLVFPTAVLPVKTVLGVLPKQVIATLVLVLYLLATRGSIPWTAALLPVVIVLQTLSMIGVSYVLAPMGAFFRDLKDVVVVFCAANFFLMPMVYRPEAIPEPFRDLLYVNPFTYMMLCYQDILYFGALAHPLAWAAFACLSLWGFSVGYRVFKKATPSLGNFL